MWCYVALCCAMNFFSDLQKCSRSFDLFKLQTCKAVSFGAIGEKRNKDYR